MGREDTPSDGSQRRLTVAVTGPTGEIGRSFIRALEGSKQVGEIRGMARRPFDPAEHGWAKTTYVQGDILDRAALDTQKARRALRWKPRHTTAATLRETVEAARAAGRLG